MDSLTSQNQTHSQDSNMTKLITKSMWEAVANPKAKYEDWQPELEKQLRAACIDTKNKVAMFLAQASHESGGFTRLTENLNYSAQGLANTWPNRYAANGKPNDLANQIARNPEMIANYTYANRMGNGDRTTGDGWKYRGRGIFQLTGKINYVEFFKSINEPVDPDKLTSIEYAVKSAIWYWNSRNISPVAELADVTKVTKLINGGTIGLADRSKLFNAAIA